METEEANSGLKRSELLDLHSHFRSSTKDELDLLYQYLNFYVGLLSAILAATLAGIFEKENLGARIRELYLLVGPFLILVLSSIGISTVDVFYRRFVQAWVTTTNIEGMLQLTGGGRFDAGVAAPPYPSKSGGFIPGIEAPSIKEIFDKGRLESWPAEKVVDGLVEIGITRANAKKTFNSFRIAGCLIAVAIIADVIRG